MATWDHILVVDDDGEIRALLRQYLEKSGYRVSLCCGRPGHVERNRWEPADIVVPDLMMPGDAAFHRESAGLEARLSLPRHPVAN